MREPASDGTNSGDNLEVNNVWQRQTEGGSDAETNLSGSRERVGEGINKSTLTQVHRNGSVTGGVSRHEKKLGRGWQKEKKRKKKDPGARRERKGTGGGVGENWL